MEGVGTGDRGAPTKESGRLLRGGVMVVCGGGYVWRRRMKVVRVIKRSRATTAPLEGGERANGGGRER